MSKLATISSKRQLTLPAKVMDHYGLKPGQKIYIDDSGEEIVLTSKTPLERFIERAKLVAASLDVVSATNLVDPLAERRKLRSGWSKRDDQLKKAWRKQ